MTDFIKRHTKERELLAFMLLQQVLYFRQYARRHILFAHRVEHKYFKCTSDNRSALNAKVGKGARGEFPQ
jgi:hypothetical protein